MTSRILSSKHFSAIASLRKRFFTSLNKTQSIKSVNDAKQLLDYIEKVEPYLTSLIVKQATRTNGEVVGLQYRLKKRDKLDGKLRKKGGDATAVRDALRYTILYSPEHYVRGVQSVFDSLRRNRKMTFKMNFIKVRWCRGDLYRGINTSWIFRQTSGKEQSNTYAFELQFHTRDSLQAKEAIHSLYDKFEELQCDSKTISSQSFPKCHKIINRMRVRMDKVKTPPQLQTDRCMLPLDLWKKSFQADRKPTKRVASLPVGSVYVGAVKVYQAKLSAMRVKSAKTLRTLRKGEERLIKEWKKRAFKDRPNGIKILSNQVFINLPNSSPQLRIVALKS